MFTSVSAAQDFSTCLRCQYRLALRHRSTFGRRHRLQNKAAPRHITSDCRLSQNEGQVDPINSVDENHPPLAHQSNGVKLHRRHWKRDDIYTTGTLDTDALGVPAEILLLRQAQSTDVPIHTNKAEDAIENHNFSISPTGILKDIKEEDAIINAERVPINIDALKQTWVSQLQDRFGSPTEEEYLQMIDSLQTGFTVTQLKDFYEAEMAKLLESEFELSRPHSTDLYTRSSWEPGCSPFSDEAARQLLSTRSRHMRILKKDEDGKQKASEKLKESKKNATSKNSLAKRIIRLVWNVKVLKDIGELDVWIKPIHFAILLSDRKNMFKKAVKSYGAKVDVSQSRNVIRITSDRDTCCDVFKLIHRALENIYDVDVYLPPEPRSTGSPWLDEPKLLSESLIEQIEQLTGTAIRQIPRLKSKRKDDDRQYRIFYIGPDKEDLEIAIGSLTRTSQPTASKIPVVVWDDRELGKGGPRPIEGGEVLPLLARGIQWSRWASPIQRSSQASEMNQAPDLSNDWLQSVSTSTFNMLFNHANPYPLNHLERYTGLFWDKTPKRETFANFGQVLYPSNKLHELHRALDAKRITVQNKSFRTCLASQRQLICGFPGLRGLLQDVQSDMQAGEDLRIRLKPSPETVMKEEDGRIFPELELWINCNPTAQTCHLSDARLIVDRREVDLLLPTETVDIRFCSETHIPSGAQIDPQILAFINSSNVDIFASDPLKTPSTLSLSIPARSVRKSPPQGAVRARSAKKSAKSEDPWLEDGPDVAVNYVLSSVEHWSHMSGKTQGLDVDYSVVDGGKWGRRVEIRMMLRKEVELRLNQAVFKAHFKALPKLIEQLRDVNHIATSGAQTTVLRDSGMGDV